MFSLQEKVESSSGRDSPSLDDLEEKKRRLLDALLGAENASPAPSTATVDQKESDDDPEDTAPVDEAVNAESDEKPTDNNPNISLEAESNKKDMTIETDKEETKTDESKEKQTIEIPSPSPKEPIASNSVEKAVSTPESKAGHVKTTLYGTPVMNIASPYVKLPSDDKFAKDICDVINFENLPNSTGKYKQISHMLKRVKSEVDRIQDS